MYKNQNSNGVYRTLSLFYTTPTPIKTLSNEFVTKSGCTIIVWTPHNGLWTLLLWGNFICRICSRFPNVRCKLFNSPEKDRSITVILGWHHSLAETNYKIALGWSIRLVWIGFHVNCALAILLLKLLRYKTL